MSDGSSRLVGPAQSAVTPTENICVEAASAGSNSCTQWASVDTPFILGYTPSRFSESHQTLADPYYGECGTSGCTGTVTLGAFVQGQYDTIGVKTALGQVNGLFSYQVDALTARGAAGFGAELERAFDPKNGAAVSEGKIYGLKAEATLAKAEGSIGLRLGPVDIRLSAGVTAGAETTIGLIHQPGEQTSFAIGLAALLKVGLSVTLLEDEPETGQWLHNGGVSDGPIPTP